MNFLCSNIIKDYGTSGLVITKERPLGGILLTACDKGVGMFGGMNDQSPRYKRSICLLLTIEHSTRNQLMSRQSAYHHLDFRHRIQHREPAYEQAKCIITILTYIQGIPLQKPAATPLEIMYDAQSRNENGAFFKQHRTEKSAGCVMVLTCKFGPCEVHENRLQSMQ